MSLETWKEEFYPTPANKVEKADALDHSIKKWEGLQKKNLKRHGVEDVGGYVINPDDNLFGLSIDASSCALCQHFYNYLYCVGCPMVVSAGQQCETEPSAWIFYTETGNPRHMLALLKRVKKLMEKEQKESKR